VPSQEMVRIPWPVMKAVVLLYLAAIAYSVVRYAVFMPANLEHLPVYIVNKGVSMAAALCFAAGFLQQLRMKRGEAGGNESSLWFRAGVYGAIVHVPMSLAILRPEYFGEFFGDGRMSFAGEMVFLFGGLTAANLFLLLRPQWSPEGRWRVSLAAMLTLLAHVSAMGYCRGLNINSSHAYLPPMWLLSAIGIVAAIWWLVRSRPQRASGGESDFPPRA
jgi:hypothetical protein